ncbi:hypothetical protein KP509_31G013400 [Ceratopteris richardii]|uniref:Uncharacterized protein n=1 Tax=Ceratopteris richardii TaxID=49495 RepID=A0A8T2QXB6_CERRI|nr:hypothetical protein KP509_31G013400 [Ceratopteris richardii]
MQTRFTGFTTRPRTTADDAQRCRELERALANTERRMEARAAEFERVKRELEWKINDLQREVEEIQTRHAARENEIQKETVHAFEEIQKMIKESNKVCLEGLSQLESSVQVEQNAISSLREELNSSFDQISKSLQSTVNT